MSPSPLDRFLSTAARGSKPTITRGKIQPEVDAQPAQNGQQEGGDHVHRADHQPGHPERHQQTRGQRSKHQQHLAKPRQSDGDDQENQQPGGAGGAAGVAQRRVPLVPLQGIGPTHKSLDACPVADAFAGAGDRGVHVRHERRIVLQLRGWKHRLKEKGQHAGVFAHVIERRAVGVGLHTHAAEHVLGAGLALAHLKAGAILRDKGVKRPRGLGDPLPGRGGIRLIAVRIVVNVVFEVEVESRPLLALGLELVVQALTRLLQVCCVQKEGRRLGDARNVDADGDLALDPLTGREVGADGFGELLERPGVHVIWPHQAHVHELQTGIP